MEVESGVLVGYEKSHPGFLAFYSHLLGYYFGACPRKHPAVAARMARAFQALGKEAGPALREFSREGLFSGRGLSHRRHVELFWTSPLFAVFEAAVGYTPPPDISIEAHLPAPVESKIGLIRRRVETIGRVAAGDLASGELPYWKASLANCAPELYLWPFLPPTGPVRGFDLGCGWGRGSLCLRQFDRCELLALDLSSAQLKVLRRQAKFLGWKGLSTEVAAALPPGRELYDFGLCQAMLHLLEEAQLEATLRKALAAIRLHGVFHVEYPTASPLGATMINSLSGQRLIDLFHRVEEGGKIFQLVEYDPRIPDLFTFGVFSAGEWPGRERTGRTAHQTRLSARRRLSGTAAQ